MTNPSQSYSHVSPTCFFECSYNNFYSILHVFYLAGQKKKIDMVIHTSTKSSSVWVVKSGLTSGGVVREFCHFQRKKCRRPTSSHTYTQSIETERKEMGRPPRYPCTNLYAFGVTIATFRRFSGSLKYSSARQRLERLYKSFSGAKDISRPKFVPS